MLKIWFVILVSLNSNGDVNSSLRYPLKPEYNTEKQCEESLTALADQLQSELGTANSRVYYLCTPIAIDELKKLDPGI